MSNNKLGSKRDQEVIRPLLVAGRSYRDCADLLGWKYGRVSEAARATMGMPSDSRDGRTLRARSPRAQSPFAKRLAVLAALRASVEARRASVAETL